MPEPQDVAGREAYRKSLEMNHAGTPSHGRRTKPMSASRREELVRLYDIAMNKSNPTP